MKKLVVVTVSSILVVSVLGFIIWRLQAEKTEQPARTVEVRRQTVTKDISFTGAVESKQSANISFELPGVVQQIFVTVGDTVTKGQRLALLDPQSIELELAKAHADKARATSAEQLAWQKATTDAKNTESENAKIVEQKRQAVRDAKATLDQSNEVFQQKAVESGDQSSTTLTAYSSVLANKAAYNSAKTALEAAIQTSTKSNETAKKAADIAYAGYISTTQASLTDTGLSSLAALERLARVRASKGTIRAPFSGVVTKKHFEIGELASIGSPVVTIETIDTLQISANVPETDAFAIAKDMEASITFDALSTNTSANARVQTIHPSAITMEGVPTFHVKLSIDTINTNLKSGITANITVHAAKKENVLAIPRRAVITKSEKQFVRKQTADKEPIEVEITTGLIGSDGLIEVTSGLGEKDIIVTP